MLKIIKTIQIIKITVIEKYKLTKLKNCKSIGPNSYICKIEN